MIWVIVLKTQTPKASSLKDDGGNVCIKLDFGKRIGIAVARRY